MCRDHGWQKEWTTDPGRYDLLRHAAASRRLRSSGAPSPRAAWAEAVSATRGGVGKRKREETTEDDDQEEEPIVITMAPAAAQPRAATATGQAVITIPRTYTHETASNLFVFAELTGASGFLLLCVRLFPFLFLFLWARVLYSSASISTQERASETSPSPSTRGLSA